MGVPSIVIDPKGYITTFPTLQVFRKEDFRSWINE